MGTGKNFRQREADSGGAWLRKFKPVPIFSVTVIPNWSTKPPYGAIAPIIPATL
jgi:hypothetical protein